MLATQIRLWMVVAALALAVGCRDKSVSAKVAAERLQQSYEKTDASTKQDVAQAGAALQAGKYVQALTTMDRVAQARPADEAQKRAVDLLIQQTQEAVRQNPKLNTPELYKARAKLIERVHGEN